MKPTLCFVQLFVQTYRPQLVCCNSEARPTLSLNLQHEIDDSVGLVGYSEALQG
jgi:hypothetical protein